MDVFIGKPGLRQAVSRPNRFRQEVGHAVAAAIERLPRHTAKKPLGDAGGQPVYGDDDAGGDALRVLALEHGVHHGAASAVHRDDAVEDVDLAGREAVFQIALVEEGDVHRGRLVDGAELHKLHAAPDIRQRARCRGRRPDADRGIERRVRDRIARPPILIRAGEEAQHIPHRVKAELFERFGAFVPDALQVLYGGIGSDHAVSASSAPPLSASSVSSSTGYGGT